MTFSATQVSVLQAALDEVERNGLAGLRIEAVVEGSGLSRATVYRQFPDGKDGLLRALVAWETARFWERVAVMSRTYEGLEDRLTFGLMRASALIGEHKLLRALLDREAALLLPLIEAADEQVRIVLEAELAAMVRAEPSERRRPGVDPAEAATYLALMLRSLIASPAGWDLTSESVTRELVRSQLIGGIVYVGDSGDS